MIITGEVTRALQYSLAISVILNRSVESTLIWEIQFGNRGSEGFQSSFRTVATVIQN